MSSSQGCGSVVSAPFTVTVRPDVVPPLVSGVQTICYSTSAGVLSRTDATGSDGNFTYQWQSSPNGSTGWTNVGASGLTYSPGVLTSSRWYRVSCSTSVCGTEYSNAVKVNVRNPISTGLFSITSTDICYDTGTSLTVGVASGADSVYGYVWERRLPGGVWSSDPASVNGLTFSTGLLTTTTQYRVIVTSGCNVTDTSNVYTVDVADEFIKGNISISGGIDSLCFADIPVQLSAVGYSGGRQPYTYQWEYKNIGQNWSVVGANSNTYQESNKLFEDAFYKVSVSSSQMCGTLTTDSIRMRVNQLPAYDSTRIKGLTSVCSNTKGQFYRIFPENNDSIRWQFSSGQVVSASNDRIFIDIDSIIGPKYDTLIATIIDRRTLCERKLTLPIFIKPDYSPSTTSVVWKNPSRILICADSTNGMSYKWGFYNRSTGIKSLVQSDTLRYCQYPSTIDTASKLYYVRTIFQGCGTTTFYNQSYSPLNISENGVKKLKVYPNPAIDRVYIEGNLSSDAVFEIINSNGSVRTLKPSILNYGNQWIINLDFPQGLYVLRVSSNQDVYLSTLIINN